MFYTAITGWWLIGARKAVQERTGVGYARKRSAANTPNTPGARWEMSNGSAFEPAPRLQVRVLEASAPDTNWRIDWG